MQYFPEKLPHGELTEIFPDVFFVVGQSKFEFQDNKFQFSRSMTVIRDGDSLTLVNSMRLDDAGLAAQIDFVTGIDDHAGIAIDTGLSEPVAGVQEAKFFVPAFFRYCGFDLTLDFHFRHRKPFDNEARSNGGIAFQVTADGVVDAGAISRICQVGCHLADMINA